MVLIPDMPEHRLLVKNALRRTAGRLYVRAYFVIARIDIGLRGFNVLQ